MAKKKSNKGADAGTQYSGWTKNPHEKSDKKEKTKGVVSTKANTVGKVIESAEVASPKITNVYSADFSTIDNIIEEIKKETRKNGDSAYSCNNIYIALEETLKKVKLARN